jgi:hypothetical protein
MRRRLALDDDRAAVAGEADFLDSGHEVEIVLRRCSPAA